MRHGSFVVAMVFVCPLVAAVAPAPPAAAQESGLGRAQASSPAGRSGVLVSLSALAGTSGFGGIATLSVPLDRVARGPAEAHASLTYLPASPDVARRAVAAAWRVAGLGESDARLDAMAARARWSALLPEARVRVLRHATDTTHTTASDTATSTADTPYYLYDSNSLWLEGRLTWRLDRLVFAEEEPTIERLRLDRQESRTRVAARVVELLARWQRASVDAAQAPPGTADWLDAASRELEAASALEVMTAGWFGRWREEIAR